MTSIAVPFQQSIRFRLSLIIAGVIFLAVMSVSAANGSRELQRSAAARADLLEGAASGYSAALSDPLANRDLRAAYGIMRGVRDLKSVLHVALTDADGNTFAQIGGGAMLLGRDGDLRTLSGLRLLEADRASVHHDIVKGGERIGEISILADISDLRADLIASLGWTALIALIAIGAGVVAAQAIIARLTRPIRDLTAVMAEIGAEQDFSRRVAVPARKDESGVLGEAFNGMIGAINERDERLARHLETLEATVEERTHDLRLAKEDAESANAAKSDFLATMSHEIRTPMNGMMVMAEMLAAADLSARHRRYAEIISRSGASLLTIINDILDLSKIEAGKLDLEAVPFSPDALVEDVAALFWEKARSKGLELSVYVGPSVPAMVIGDPTRFNQVVTNLVNNALKFTEKGGVSIGVTAKTADDQARLNVAVADTGVGIEQSRIASIFEAFSQADQSTTRKFGGTGLGLTVCKRLVDAMGGDIGVASEPGKGSVFTVSVDLAVDQKAPLAPDASGLKAALVLPPGQAVLNLGRALKDLGADIRRLASPADGQPGELVLAPSDAFGDPAPSGVHAVCLSDIGDSRADALLRSGVAVDLLPLPVGRRSLWDLAERARRSDFRGLSALAGAGVEGQLETFSGLSVLAVDDNAVNREVLREALITLGVEADLVEDGQQAVDAASSRRYDVIFMDGSMPVMDGFTATKRIRAHEVEQGVTPSRIIALTAQVRGVDADAWATAGADQHMTKPFTARRLVEALRTAQASNGQAASPTAAAPPMTPAADLMNEEAIGTMEAIMSRSGRDVLGKVWKLFLGQAPHAVSTLQAIPVQPEQAEQIAKQAHALKSMCLSGGAAGMAVICEALETSAKAGELDEVAERMPDLTSALAATQAEMQRRLEARNAPAALQS
ncbi:MAG: response regulator [Alphaproteobacteria bacterium]|nr:response regulator [Alphaproteobacteria bacterium]